MKTVAMILLMLPTMTCLLFAGFMAYSGVSGWVWAWFLIAACLLSDMEIKVKP